MFMDNVKGRKLSLSPFLIVLVQLHTLAFAQYSSSQNILQPLPAKSNSSKSNNKNLQLKLIDTMESFSKFSVILMAMFLLLVAALPIEGGTSLENKDGDTTPNPWIDPKYSSVLSIGPSSTTMSEVEPSKAVVFQDKGKLISNTALAIPKCECTSL